MTTRLDSLQENILANGGFSIFQRGGVSSAVNMTTSADYEAPDRWLQWYTGTVTGNVTTERSSVSPNYRSKYSNKINFQRNSSTLVLSWEQRLEAIDAEPLINKEKLSLGVWVKSPIASSQVRLTLLYPTVEDDHTSQTEITQETIDLSGTDWEIVEFENKSVSVNMNYGLAVRIEVLIPTGTDASAESLYLTQAMLSSGSTARDFRQYGGDLHDEIQKCQRFYEKSYNLDTEPGTITNVGRVCSGPHSITGGPDMVHYKIKKRTNATPRLYSPATGTIDRVYQAVGGPAGDIIPSIITAENSESRFHFDWSLTGGNVDLFYHWIADAEL
jgi:hypothetical protein